MPKPHNHSDLPVPRPDNQDYDIEHLENVVRAMDFLSKEARKTGVEEVATIVESTFKIVNMAYYSILRLDMMNLPAADDPVPLDG